MNHKILLADIGNTHIHIFDGTTVEHRAYEDAIERYGKQELFYISVNQLLEEKITKQTNWQNISPLVTLEGAYDTMGVDRRALCLSHHDGLLVDAGSAITVDVMGEGVYEGGFILPGMKATLGSYAEISPALVCEFNPGVSLESLPHTTADGISYGIIAPIKAVIAMHQRGKTVYFTGGDGAILSSLFEGSVFDETLVFQGMLQALKKTNNHKQG